MICKDYKEACDDKADYQDVIATVFGGMIAAMVFLLREAFLGFYIMSYRPKSLGWTTR